MAKIYREGVQIYPETTPDMVVELSTGKDVKELIGDAKSDMRTLMTGVADGIDPKKYPFKDFGNVMGLDALNDLLDSMHGSSDDMMAGWFRVNNQGILFQILNFATSYANDEYVQMVIGPFGISQSTGKIVNSNTFNVATRRHVGGNSPYWTEWRDLNSIDNDVYKIPGSFNLISNNVGDTSENKVQVGDAKKLYDAIISGKIITDGEFVILNVLPASTDYKYALFYTYGGIYYAVYVLFNVSISSDGIIKINGISTLNREVINIVVDNLNSDSSLQPLSANQGKVLNEKITALTNTVNSISGQFIIHDTTYDVDTSTGIGISQLWNSIINGVSDYRDYISAYNAIFHNTNSNGVHTTFEFIKGVEEMCTIKNSLGDMYLAEMTSGSQVYINKLKRVTTTNEPIS